MKKLKEMDKHMKRWIVILITALGGNACRGRMRTRAAARRENFGRRRHRQRLCLARRLGIRSLHTARNDPVGRKFLGDGMGFGRFRGHLLQGDGPDAGLCARSRDLLAGGPLLGRAARATGARSAATISASGRTLRTASRRASRGAYRPKRRSRWLGTPCCSEPPT